MTNNRSDYNKPRFNINSFIPQHLKNDLSTSLFENLHNRFLSKDESTYQRGSVGRPTPGISDRLPEYSTFRRAYQLQPHVVSEVDSNVDIANWEDIVGRASVIGIDVNQVSDWASTERFNFAPPINPDKLINYRDYYWVGDTTPEYITIQNLATAYRAKDRELTDQLNQALAKSPVDQQEIDQIEFLILANQTKLNLAINESSGWDTGYFDDNGGVHASVDQPTNVVDFGVSLAPGLNYQLNGEFIQPISVSGTVASFTTVINPVDDIVVNLPWFYAINPGSSTPTNAFGWYNLTDGLLYRLDTVSSTWVVVDPQPTNEIGFDQYINKTASQRQWSDSNLWVHRKFVDQLTGTTQAQLPIIEYLHGTKLNEYLRVQYRWKYRATMMDPFVSVDTEPSNVELSVRHPIINANPVVDQFLLTVGDVTTSYPHGKQFTVEGGSYPYRTIHLTVQESVYADGSTRVYTTNPIDITLPEQGSLVPISVTSLGDRYLGVHHHWVLDRIERPIPSDIDRPYSPSQKQQIVVVGQNTNSTLYTKYNNATGFWEMVSGQLPSTVFVGDTLYLADRSQTMRITEISTNGVKLQSTNGESYVGSQQQYATLLSTKYVLRPDLAFYTGSGQLRVYVNQRRQVDNIVESITNSNATSSVGFEQLGNTIVFINEFPNMGDLILIESHVVDAGDVGREMVNVRRSEAEAFDLERRSLIRYYREEQIKYEANQYPMFDLFDVNGNHLGLTSPIWTFEEDSTYAPNKFVGDRRIKVTNQRKNYHFINHLVDETTNKLHCYKHLVGDDNVLKTMWEFERDYAPTLVNDKRQHDGDVVVDEQGNPTTISVTLDNGVWELPSQMFFNPTHSTRVKYSTTDIFAHYRSIIERQQSSGHIATVVVFEYTNGGTIKEHNQGFDNWLSSILATEVSTADIIEFAKNQYVDLLHTVKYLCLKSYGDLAVTTQSNEGIKRRTIIEQAIQLFKEGTWYNRVYGDSHSFDGTYGIENVITTVSRMGLWPVYRPYVTTDSKFNIARLSTHVGGVFDMTITQNDINRVTQQIASSSNTISSKSIPAYGSIVPGQYWYNTSNRTLHYYQVTFQQDNQPTQASDGELWINTSTAELLKYSNGNWEFLYNVTQVADLLAPVDFNQIISSTLLNIENRLFQVAAANNPSQKYDYNQLISNSQRLDSYNRYLCDCFYGYCKSAEIDPFVNNLFKLNDPFTWNYRSATNINYPNDQSQGRWTGHTAGIYTLIFGTDVPHLEPWKLQGYIAKPTWWNSTYAATTRRWVPQMWFNILNGIVPVGVRYPSGVVSSGDPTADGQQLTTYEFVPVNITDQVIAGYAPDDLLPVFVSDPLLSGFALIRKADSIDMTQIRSNWLFGDYAPTENNWRRSINFVYDQLIIASRIDPIRFLFDSFGRSVTFVDRLNVDVDTGSVYGHTNQIFHGQLHPSLNQPVRSLGINQWYSNYFRSHDVDVDISNIHDRWTKWSMSVGYPTNATVDHRSVDVYTKCSKLVDSDYRLIMKKGAGTQQINVDNLIVNTVKFGEYNITYNARSPRGYGEDWVYRIGTSSPVAKKFQYHRVKKYDAHYTGSDSSFVFDQTHKLSTGDLVRLQSTSNLPIPLNRFDDYFIIITGPNSFKLAYNRANAISGLSIDIRSGTSERFSIGAVRSTFVPMGGEHTSLTWTTFQPDTSVVLETTLPFELTGVQSVVDFVTGYSSRLVDLGVTANTEDSINLDPVTGRNWTWDLELERLIDQIYVGLGTSVNILKRDQPTLSTEFVELNPYRYRCLISPSVGIISDVFKRGPNYLRGDSLVYDQTGRLFTDDQLFVFRQDLQTNISLDTNRIPQRDPLNSIHIGGMRLMVDTYEHVILFESGNTPIGVVYDPHLGVEVQSLYVGLKRTTNTTGRPNVGGYFLSNDKLIANLDKVATDQSLFYDTNSSDQFAGYTDYAKALLGYDSPSYLDDLRLTERSKFNFWRGMIQAKGNKRTLDTIKGSMQLQDITVDEFWAYRKATFGSNRSIVDTLNVQLQLEDIKQGRLRCHFVFNDDVKQLPWINVFNGSNSRYINWIDKRKTLDSIGNFFVDATLTDVSDSIITVVNQIQTDGYPRNVTYVSTTEPYDGFILTMYREPIMLGSFIGPMFIPVGGQVPIQIDLDRKITPNTRDVIVKIDDTVLPRHQYDEFEDYVIVNVANNTNDTWIRVHVQVIQTTYELIKGQDYQQLSPTVCRIDFDVNERPLSVYGIRPDYRRTNTVELIDRVSGTIVKSIPVVMPHHQQYVSGVMLSIDKFTNVDPARYTNSLDIEVVNVAQRWGNEHNGNVWVDTSNSYYVDFYNSDRLTVDQQLDRWCERIPNTETVGYTWVTSPVPPDQWVAYTQSVEQTDESEAVPSGYPLLRLYRRSRESIEVGFGPWEPVLGEAYVNRPFCMLATDLRSYIIDSPFGDVAPTNSIELFINGKFIRNVIVEPSTNTIVLPLVPGPGDDVFMRVINEEWRSFQRLGDQYQPHNPEAGLVEHFVDTPHVVTVEYIGVGGYVEPVNSYHFWVRGSSYPINTMGLNTNELTNNVNSTPDLFAIITDLKRNPSFTSPSYYRYTSIVVSGIDPWITTNDRYYLRLKVNQSMAINDNRVESSVHHEWEMFREHQPVLAPRLLWDKIVESMVGYKLTNLDPIPSNERRLYDQLHGTNTSYGIGIDQTVGERASIVDTVTAIILDPSVNVYPVDKDIFFDKYSFDTETNVIEAMDYIINNFPISTINKIVIEVLTDFMSIKPNDVNLMKTSWLSVSGNVTIDSQ